MLNNIEGEKENEDDANMAPFDQIEGETVEEDRIVTLVEIEGENAKENDENVSPVKIEGENANYRPLNINDPTVWDKFGSKF